MKEYMRCPKCRSFQRIGNRLHASWTCPSCHNSIVPRENKKINEFRVRKILNKH